MKRSLAVGSGGSIEGTVCPSLVMSITESPTARLDSTGLGMGRHCLQSGLRRSRRRMSRREIRCITTQTEGRCASEVRGRIVEYG